MPGIQIDMDFKAFERSSDFTFEPGEMEIEVGGREVLREWVQDEDPGGNGGNDPGVTLGQVATLERLLSVGVKLTINEDGSIEGVTP